MHLAVGPLRPDGFHELRTVYLAVSLYDTVTVAPGSGLSLTVTGEGTGAATGGAVVPTDPRNLVWRAAELLARHAGVPADASIGDREVHPGGRRPGGGQRGRRGRAGRPRRAVGHPREPAPTSCELAAQLGSDVPFSLLGGIALGTGRGEQLSPVLARTPWHWVLGIAGEGLSTPAVYAELDRLRAEGRVPDGAELTPSEPVIAALRSGPPAALAAALGNDLQAPALALRPGLRRALSAASDAGAAAVLVSGSGPTVAALAEDEADAVRLAATLAGAGVFRTVRAVSGPVPGARLVG